VRKKDVNATEVGLDVVAAPVEVADKVDEKKRWQKQELNLVKQML